MRRRFYNEKDDSLLHYGGRGITVCDQWRENFDQFFSDMGEPQEGMSLERINNDLGYSPENCRWATLEEQLNNQRRNRRIEHNGKIKNLSQWAAEKGLKMDTLIKRLKRMPPERALQSGSLRDWKHGTRTGYDTYKCRCDACREVHNKKYRDRRARLKAAQQVAL